MPRPIDNTATAPDFDLTGLSIDRKADVPIGVQLAWALRTRIVEGLIGAGGRLPALRDLAEATGVNVNTVRAVYQRLEQDGLIDRQQGSGTFVAPAPPQTGAVGAITANAACEAREIGVDPRDVAAALYVTPDDSRRSEGAIESAQTERSEVVRRRALREQIATLERTVAELETEHPGVAPAPGRTRRGIGPALLTVDELANVRTVLIRRLTVVQAAIDVHIEEQRAVARTETAVRRPRETKAKDKAKSTAASKQAPRARATTRPAPASG